MTGSRTDRPSAGARPLALLALWALLFGTWMLLVDTASVAEFVAGAAAAAAGTLAAALAYERGILEMRPHARLLLGAGRQLARVPGDLWLLARELARAVSGDRTPGRFHTLELELPADPLGNARRGAIELLGSLAPNTIVVGVDERTVIVHQLAARAQERSSLREVRG